MEKKVLKPRGKESKTKDNTVKELPTREKVGEIAGKIWGILKQKEKVNISQLPKLVKEKSDITYQAVGWLAREGKILYNSEKSKVYLTLTEEEKMAASK